MTDIRLAILSDLHLDVRRRLAEKNGTDPDRAIAGISAATRAAVDGADVVVLAGDIANGTRGIGWAAATFPGLPVVYVSGNHEFYNHDNAALIADLRTAAATAGIHFLDGDACTLDIRGRALRLLGCTAWTDYRLYGPEVAATARERAADLLHDHKRIRFGDGLFRPEDAAGLHEVATGWLDAELGRDHPGPTVVVTHHAPTPRSVAPRFAGDSLSPAFASDLTALIARHGPPLWIHGHTHHNVDYRVGASRIVSHQWGYPGEGLSEGCLIVAV
ncbi:MAG: metallophosphoesterase [Ferrovibrionaceae bacterium]